VARPSTALKNHPRTRWSHLVIKKRIGKAEDKERSRKTAKPTKKRTHDILANI